MKTYNGIASGAGAAWKRVAAAAVVGAVGTATLGGAAFADHGINTTDTVNIRTGPATSNPIIGSVPKGVSPTYLCWVQGQHIGGVDVWFRINYGGHTGYISSYFDNSSYSSDAQITPKYGIGNCNASPPPPTASAATKAVAWAKSQVGSTRYNGLCLTLVQQAWAAGGVEIRNKVSVPWNSNTYPSMVWGHFTSGHTGVNSPPVGALLFFAGTAAQPKAYSHVEIYVGNNQAVSSDDTQGARVHYETFGQKPRYLGWWMPV